MHGWVMLKGWVKSICVVYERVFQEFLSSSASPDLFVRLNVDLFTDFQIFVAADSMMLIDWSLLITSFTLKSD